MAYQECDPPQPDMLPDLTMTTFLHEMVHVIDRHLVRDAQDETATHAIAEGFYQLLTNLGIEFDWSEIKNGE